MKRIIAIIATLCALPTAAYAQAAPVPLLSDSLVEAAIAYGRSHTDGLLGMPLGVLTSRCGGGAGGSGDCGYQIIVQGASGRIATLAAAAASQYRPYTAADVTPELRESYITVLVSPTAPWLSPTGWTQQPNVDRVLLQSVEQLRAGQREVIEPVSVQPLPLEWDNGLGGHFTGSGQIAAFAPSQVPSGEFHILILTPAGEVRAVVRKRDWDRNAVFLR
jgi:hypothetical protein